MKVEDPDKKPSFILPTGQQTELRSGFNTILGRWSIEKGPENELCLYEEIYFGQGIEIFSICINHDSFHHLTLCSLRNQ